MPETVAEQVTTAGEDGVQTLQVPTTEPVEVEQPVEVEPVEVPEGAETKVTPEEGAVETPKKVDAETRVKEALEKASAAEAETKRLSEAFAEMQKQQAAKERPFKDISIQEVNAIVTEAKADIEALELAGNAYEAALSRRRLDKFISEVEDNESKKKAWEEDQGKAKTAEDQKTKDLAGMHEASEFYRKSRGIPEETWDAAGKFLFKYFNDNPIDGRKFVEIVQRQGAMQAYAFAEELVTKEYGKAQAEKKRVDDAKTASQVVGTASVTNAVVDPDKESVTDYFKRRTAELKKSR